MTDALLEELLAARRARTPCALVTVAATKGSVPREAGSKMLVYADGVISGTVGGGKFESLVIEETLGRLREKTPLLKTYSLREDAADSFGAICGGEVTILIEPQNLNEAVFLIGAGHCAQAIAKLCGDCGLFVTVVDDRSEFTENLPDHVSAVVQTNPAEFIRNRPWRSDEALVIVSRNYEIDRDALAAALSLPGIGYIGMIGSRRKVKRVFDQLKEDGISDGLLRQVYAPLGLDIAADSPAEIAVSVVAEILAVLRNRSIGHLRMGLRPVNSEASSSARPPQK
jgi:xanthine dehydrogenase accessory factor